MTPGGGAVGYPHWINPPPARKNFPARRPGAQRTRAPQNSFPRAAPPLGQSMGTSPSGRTAASRRGAVADGTVRPPRASRAVGPSSHRKALWEGCALFLTSPFFRTVWRRGSGQSRACGRLASDDWGARQERAAALSLVRLAPRPGRVRGSRSLNAWRAVAWSGLRHIVGETSESPEAAPGLCSHARRCGEGGEGFGVDWSSTVCQGIFNRSGAFLRVTGKGLTV